MSRTSENREIIELDLPERESNPGYLNILFRYLSMMAATIVDMESYSDLRVSMLTDLMISTIPNKKTKDLRKKIRKFKAVEIAKRVEAAELEAEENGTTLTNEGEAKIVIEVCLETIGLITDFMDESIGISRKLEIGVS